jgi:alpha-L-fucosidase
MATINYSPTSPYATTENFGKFKDVLTYRAITKKADDVVYVIDTVYQYRPDMLAHDLYGDSALWWVFAVRNPNSLQDPVFGFYAGLPIYLPSKQTLITDLGI